MNKLYIIIPAYNEAENIELVVREWHEVVSQVSGASRLVVIDDGSRDDTYEILCSLKAQLPQMEVLTKENSGHGATLLFGYHHALRAGADYVFQTDSDGQTVAAEFMPFWKKRTEYQAVIGCRKHREDGISRVFVTKVLKLVILFVFGVRVADANTPFRLMNRELLQRYIKQVPKDFNLSNVLLTVLFVKNKEKVVFMPITFRPRQGGTNSINMKRIITIGIRAVKDFWVIKRTLRAN